MKIFLEEKGSKKIPNMANLRLDYEFLAGRARKTMVRRGVRRRSLEGELDDNLIVSFYFSKKGLEKKSSSLCLSKSFNLIDSMLSIKIIKRELLESDFDDKELFSN
ncbi:hypothetical protein RUM44_008708 [Polyplax serrata]|uniref:Uncharacterized protein n=1 Tax=Polyplax serrata TaxID=468196 RepID=A0ABR1BD47_POLSC